jgi:hypothetical protein
LRPEAVAEGAQVSADLQQSYIASAQHFQAREDLYLKGSLEHIEAHYLYSPAFAFFSRHFFSCHCKSCCRSWWSSTCWHSPGDQTGSEIPETALALIFTFYLAAFIWLDMVWELSLGIVIFGYLLATSEQK